MAAQTSDNTDTNTPPVENNENNETNEVAIPPAAVPISLLSIMVHNSCSRSLTNSKHKTTYPLWPALLTPVWVRLARL